MDRCKQLFCTWKGIDKVKRLVSLCCGGSVLVVGILTILNIFNAFDLINFIRQVRFQIGLSFVIDKDAILCTFATRTHALTNNVARHPPLSTTEAQRWTHHRPLQSLDWTAIQE